MPSATISQSNRKSGNSIYPTDLPVAFYVAYPLEFSSEHSTSPLLEVVKSETQRFQQMTQLQQEYFEDRDTTDGWAMYSESDMIIYIEDLTAALVPKILALLAEHSPGSALEGFNWEKDKKIISTLTTNLYELLEDWVGGYFDRGDAFNYPPKTWLQNWTDGIFDAVHRTAAQVLGKDPYPKQ